MIDGNMDGSIHIDNPTNPNDSLSIRYFVASKGCQYGVLLPATQITKVTQMCTNKKTVLFFFIFENVFCE